MQVISPVQEDLLLVEAALGEATRSDSPILGEAMTHLLNSGGKRLRPALALFTAHLGDFDFARTLPLAMVVEFIHTATLVHDDVIDRAATRRGYPTVHVRWDSNVAIIVGDYYFARAANLMGQLPPRIIDLISRAVMKICEGELLQMSLARDIRQSVEDYFLKIEHKTATLVSASCEGGGIIAGLDAPLVQALRAYGWNLGMAFQIADDALDYVASAEELGKPAGADLRQGTVTLPLMYALRERSVAAELSRLLRLDQPSPEPAEGEAWKGSGVAWLEEEQLLRVIDLVRSSEAVDNAYGHATRFAEAALEGLKAFPPSPYRDSLETMAGFVVERRL